LEGLDELAVATAMNHPPHTDTARPGCCTRLTADVSDRAQSRPGAAVVFVSSVDEGGVSYRA
jgi:hypothetical protein